MSLRAQAARILCVHQGFELFGSDRTFLQSLRALRQRFPLAEITALLPQDGPLSEEVAPIVDTLGTEDLLVLRRAHLRRPREMFRSWRKVRNAMGWIGRHDLTYINTIVLADFALASRFARSPSMLHVHELPIGPERFAFSAMLAASGASLVFNSHATRDTFVLPAWRRTTVVHNGVCGPHTLPAPAAPDGRPLRLLTLGRFSSWKGQGLVVDAIGELSDDERRRVEARIVGSAFEGQEHHEREIHERIARHAVGDRVRVEPFRKDPSDLYAWADVVVVPSLKPEPFGLVAIEAMAHGRPVIAANHGGLVEIVQEGKTGLCFRPGDSTALAAGLREYLAHPERVPVHGAAGAERFRECFQEDRYLDAIGDVAAAVLTRGPFPC